MNFYNISQVSNRQQIAQHYHSSLQQPTLENVEAQLYVTRQRNYQLSQKYFEQKYGSSKVYDNFVQNNNLIGLEAPKQPLYDFKQYLKRKAEDIREQQTKKLEQKRNRQIKIKVNNININEQNNNIDGYDSDPQIYNNSSNPPKFVHSKNNKSLTKFKETAQSFIQPNQHSRYQNQKSNLKVTVPQPFSFQLRQKAKLVEKAENDSKSQFKKEQKYVFKAKQIPSKVAQVGLYQKIMQEQKRKNQQRRKSGMLISMAQQKPFSFLQRKTQKKNKQQRQQFVFKAKPIPWYCSVDLLQRKKQQQIGRNQKIAKAAQQSLTKAKLPPRMEKDFLQKKAKQNIQNNAPKRPQSAIKIKQPPNFQKLHKQFEQALQRKRKQSKKTQIVQFNFTSNNRNSSKIKKNQTIQQFKQKKNQIPINKSNFDIFAQSTAKFTQQVEKRRRQIQEKRRRQEQKRKQQQQRQKVDEQLKKKVQQKAKRNQQNKDKQYQQKRKQQIAKQNEAFKNWKKQCIQKGRQQPLLINREQKRDEKISKMKKLYEISKTLKDNGITGKQHDHYFKRQQLLMLEDYKILKDKL